MTLQYEVVYVLVTNCGSVLVGWVVLAASALVVAMHFSGFFWQSGPLPGLAVAAARAERRRGTAKDLKYMILELKDFDNM